MNQLKEKVKELRRRKGWAQEDLAREISVSLSTVQRGRKKVVNLLASPAENSKDFSEKPGLMTLTKAR